VSLDAAGRRVLSELVAAGAKLCADKLTGATHDRWHVEEVTLSIDEAGPFAEAFNSVVHDHYGTELVFPGGGFLVLFSGKSGYLVTNAFTREIQDRVEGLNQREANALGELCNILLNPMVGHLAQAWGFRLVVSAPRTRISSRRELLTESLASYKESDALAATFFIRLRCESLFSDCHILLFLERPLVEAISRPRSAAS